MNMAVLATSRLALSQFRTSFSIASKESSLKLAGCPSNIPSGLTIDTAGSALVLKVEQVDNVLEMRRQIYGGIKLKAPP
jgi:hypothetical protein